MPDHTALRVLAHSCIEVDAVLAEYFVDGAPVAQLVAVASSGLLTGASTAHEVLSTLVVWVEHTVVALVVVLVLD